MTKENKLLSLIPAALGLVLTVGVMTVFSTCGPRDNGTWMNCHNTQTAVAVCGTVLTVLFVLMIFVENRAAAMICSAAALVLSIVIFLLPGFLMLNCALETMRCNSVMKPFVWIMAFLEAFSVFRSVLKAVQKRQQQ